MLLLLIHCFINACLSETHTQVQTFSLHVSELIEMKLEFAMDIIVLLALALELSIHIFIFLFIYQESSDL